jgi:hypothetical protein
MSPPVFSSLFYCQSFSHYFVVRNELLDSFLLYCIYCDVQGYKVSGGFGEDRCELKAERTG